MATDSQVPFAVSGTVTVPDPAVYSRVLAVSDVHGMIDPVLRLLRENGIIDADRAWTAGNALLLVVGDSIDKGPGSVEVLDLWMDLTKRAEAAGGRVIHLLGNHEADFLADPTPSNEKARELLEELRRKGIPVSSLTDPRQPRGRFLRSMPVAARVGGWLFCHAGYLPAMSWEQLTAKATEVLSRGDYRDPLLDGKTSIIEAKKWWLDGSETRREALKRLDAAGFAGVVFGHQPRGLNVAGASAISRDGRLIKIDNGMAPEAGAHSGGILMFPEPSELVASRRPQAATLVGGQPLRLESERQAGEAPASRNPR